MELTDSEIIERFNDESGKNYAFNLLVRKYQKKLYYVVRRMVIDHDDANDLVQNVWIKVWANLHTFKSESNLYTWLYRIATNETLTFLNKKKKRLLVPIVDVKKELMGKIDGGHFDGDEIEKKLQKAMLTLPEKQRLVFQMRYYDETPYEEMSKILTTSVGALKASYHHAAKKIEEIITNKD